jgi:hypothetical protein
VDGRSGWTEDGRKTARSAGIFFCRKKHTKNLGAQGTPNIKLERDTVKRDETPSATPPGSSEGGCPIDSSFAQY